MLTGIPIKSALFTLMTKRQSEKKKNVEFNLYLAERRYNKLMPDYRVIYYSAVVYCKNVCFNKLTIFSYR